MNEIQRYEAVSVWSISKDDSGSYVDYDDQTAIVAQLEADLAKVTARYNFVRDMTPEQFENTSTIHEDFDRQIDAAIKEQGK